MVTWKDIRYGDQSNHTDECERQTEKVCVSECVSVHIGASMVSQWGSWTSWERARQAERMKRRAVHRGGDSFKMKTATQQRQNSPMSPPSPPLSSLTFFQFHSGHCRKLLAHRESWGSSLHFAEHCVPRRPLLRTAVKHPTAAHRSAH